MTETIWPARSKIFTILRMNEPTSTLRKQLYLNDYLQHFYTSRTHRWIKATLKVLQKKGIQKEKLNNFMNLSFKRFKIPLRSPN